MPAWCRSSDGQAAKREIEHEGKKRGWDQLSKASPKPQLSIGEAERLKFIPYLVLQYPAADVNMFFLFSIIVSLVFRRAVVVRQILLLLVKLTCFQVLVSYIFAFLPVSICSG